MVRDMNRQFDTRIRSLRLSGKRGGDHAAAASVLNAVVFMDVFLN